MANSNTGIYLNTGVDSTLLHGNTLTNVTNPIVPDGSTNTMTIA